MNTKAGFLFVLLMASATLSFGQLCVGESTYHTCPGTSNKFRWSISGGGTIVGATNSCNISVTWTSAGTYYVYYSDLLDGSNDYSEQVNVVTATGGSVSPSSTTICQNNGTSLSLSGYSGSIVRWEKSTDGGSNWQTINNTSASLSTGSLSSTTLFRAYVTNCSQYAYSSNATVNVSVPNTGNVSLSYGSGGFCTGESASGRLTVSDYSGSVFKWEKSEFISGSWGSWVNAGVLHDIDYVDFGVTVATRFRAVIGSGVCGNIPSGYYEIVETQPTVAGSLSGPSQVCSGSSFSLNLVGSVGTVQGFYKRNANGSYGSIGSISGISITQPTYFKVAVRNGNCSTTAETAEFFVDTYPSAVGGTISGGTIICQNSSTNLTLNGSSGSIVRWEKTTDGSNWQTIPNTTTSLSTGNLAVTTTYRAVLQNVCSVPMYSSSLTVTVNVPNDPGSVSLSSGNGSFCTGETASGRVTATGYTGSVFSWQKSEYISGNWTTWSTTGSGHDIDYLDFSVTVATRFRATIPSGVCSTQYSSYYEIVQTPPTVAGALSAPAEVCAGSTFSVTLSGNVGTVLNWYQHDDQHSYGGPMSTPPTNITISRPTYFKAVVQNGGCTTQLETETFVNIKAPPTIGTLTPAAQTVCELSTVTLTLSSYTGQSVRWQKEDPSTNTWVTMAENTNTQYTQNPPQVPGFWRALAVNACNLTVPSAVVEVKTTTAPTAPANTTDQWIYGNGSTVLTASASCLNCSIKWYDNANATGTPLASMQTFYTTPTLFSATTYYAFTVNSIGCLSAPTAITAQFADVLTSPSNVKTEVIRTSGITTDSQIDALTTTTKTTQYTYFDGLGRGVQSVTQGTSPSGKDIVQPYEYDVFGRAPKQYLGYTSGTDGSFKSSFKNDQLNFYATANDKVADDTAPYAVTLFEDSPLGRPVEQGQIGAGLQPGSGHTAKMGYSFNTGATASEQEEVRKFESDGTSAGFYAVNTLQRLESTDANGNKTIAFTNSEGRTLAKKVQLDQSINSVMVNYLETYYIYDNMGRMKYTISPKGVAALKTASWALGASILDQYTYQYNYDTRGRLTGKKVPGQAWMYYAYDDLNRVVLAQDGNLRSTNQWTFIKYDRKGRAVMSGLYTNSGDLATVQSLLNGQYTNPATAFYEMRGTTLHGYTNVSFPTQNADASALVVLNVTYYDNYDFDNNGTDEYSYTAQGITGEGAQGSSFGLVTGSKKLVLNTSTWLQTYQFYDRFGRVIQTRSNNHLSTAIDNLSTVVYDFEGKALQSKTYHNAGGSNQTTVVQKNAYDAVGRLQKIYHNINAASQDQLVAQYAYNELGQVVDKNLHLVLDAQQGQPGTTTGENITRTQYQGESNLVASNSIVLGTGYSVAATSTPYKAKIVTLAQAEANGTYMQSVDYRYNIQGRLTSINNAQLTADSNVTNDDNNDYFGMELLYNNVDAGLGNGATYNGNISAVKWRNVGVTTGAADQRSFVYTYDKSDKLLTTTFKAHNGSAWSKEQNTLDESMGYDHNGNILSLTRKQNQKTWTSGTTTVTSSAQTIDNLTYTYANGNRLSNVADAGIGTTGFVDAANASTVKEYTYDTLGNLKSDLNKGISLITYNMLGKAQQINFTNGNTVAYTYDAAGTKLTMTSTVSGVATTTNYVGGFVYNTNAGTSTLNFFSSPEGRVVKNGGNYEYQYALSDHQGNTRVVFTSAPQTTQSVTAGFETANQTTEANSFSNYQTGAHISILATNAHSGSNSLYLNGGYSGQVGIAKSYAVYPGDKLSIQAYAKYSASSGPSNLSGFAAALLNAFALPTPVAGETGTPASAINTWGGIEAGGYGDGSTDNTDPRVFVNIVLFDKNHKFLDVTYAQLTTSGALMSASYTVKEAGFAYLYVSNENSTLVDVYFDDVTMSYTPTNIIQNNEYYAHSMPTASSWTRDNTTNNFLGNGGTELNATTQLYDLAYRSYDAALGRFHQVDPFAHMYSSTSPLAYAVNNPIRFNDPTGLKPQTENVGMASSGSVSWDGWAEDGGGDGEDGDGGIIEITIGNYTITINMSQLTGMGVSLSFEDGYLTGVSEIQNTATDGKELWLSGFEVYRDAGGNYLPNGHAGTTMTGWIQTISNYNKTRNETWIGQAMVSNAYSPYLMTPEEGLMLAAAATGIGALELGGVTALATLGRHAASAVARHASSMATNFALSVASQAVVKQDFGKIDFLDAVFAAFGGQGWGQLGAGILGGLFDYSIDGRFVSPTDKTAFQLGADIGTGAASGIIGVGINSPGLNLSPAWQNTGGFLNNMFGDGLNTTLTSGKN